MKYNGMIENKLRLIEQKLEEIRSWEITSYEQFQKSSLLQNAAERALQVSIEVMIDISECILAIEKIPPQSTATDNFKKLQELKILTCLPDYLKMVKFRNFIVHCYERIDSEIVYTILKDKLFLFESFVRDVRNT